MGPRITCCLCPAPSRRACSKHLPVVGLHKALLKQVLPWRMAYLQGDVGDVLTGPGGVSVCLWDVMNLVRGVEHLSARQREAVMVHLVHDQMEPDAARAMGLPRDSRVSITATDGVVNLLRLAYQGEIDYDRSLLDHTSG